jgi:CHU_C Type IX secretion signal domain
MKATIIVLFLSIAPFWGIAQILVQPSIVYQNISGTVNNAIPPGIFYLTLNGVELTSEIRDYQIGIFRNFYLTAWIVSNCNDTLFDSLLVGNVGNVVVYDTSGILRLDVDADGNNSETIQCFRTLRNKNFIVAINSRSDTTFVYTNDTLRAAVPNFKALEYPFYPRNGPFWFQQFDSHQGILAEFEPISQQLVQLHPIRSDSSIVIEDIAQMPNGDIAVYGQACGNVFFRGDTFQVTNRLSDGATAPMGFWLMRLDSNYNLLSHHTIKIRRATVTDTIVFISSGIVKRNSGRLFPHPSGRLIIAFGIFSFASLDSTELFFDDAFVADWNNSFGLPYSSTLVLDSSFSFTNWNTIESTSDGIPFQTSGYTYSTVFNQNDRQLLCFGTNGMLKDRFGNSLTSATLVDTSWISYLAEFDPYLNQYKILHSFNVSIRDMYFNSNGFISIMFAKPINEQSPFDTVWFDGSSIPVIVNTLGADDNHPIIAILDTNFVCRHLFRFQDSNIMSSSVYYSLNQTRMVDSCTVLFDYGLNAGSPPTWLNSAQECYDTAAITTFGSPQLFSQVRLPPYVYPLPDTPTTACATLTVQYPPLPACGCAHWQVLNAAGTPLPGLDACAPGITFTNTGPTVLDTTLVFVLTDDAYPSIAYRRDTLRFRIFPQPQLVLDSVVNIRCTPTTTGQIGTSLRNATPPVVFTVNGSAQPYTALLSSLPPGTYALQVQDTNTCRDSLLLAVQYTPTVPAAFSTAPEAPGPVSVGDSIVATLLTDTAALAAWQWHTTDALLQLNTTTYTASPQQHGPWALHLATLDTTGCPDTARAEFTVQRLFLHLPTAFMPSSAGENASWLLPLDGLQHLHLRLFDRWGAEIWHTTAPTAAWNGHLPNGTTAPEGVYTWSLNARTLAGVPVVQSGTVTVLR